MKNKFFYLTLAISIIVLIINIIAYPSMPDKVPVHWGWNGEVNRYGSKVELLLMGVMPLLILLFRKIIPSIDPKKESYQKHGNAYSIMSFISVIFIAVLNLITVFSALGFPVSFSRIIPLLLGILMICMGNYMTQLRPNYFIGIRNPWTLASEMVWKKTHRLGGYVFVLVGLISLSSILIGGIGMALFFCALAIGIGFIYCYSYIIFKRNLG